MATVELRSARKVYAGDVEAVKGIDLEIGDEEFLVLVGPSGCGKSTTLRMIAGLEEVSDGEILIDGAVVNAVAPKDRDIAMVFQNYALYPHMTVYKNLAFGLSLRGASRQEVDRRVREAAAILGIEDLLDRRPKALSGGQRQRVAVGRAIVRDPKVFLFDEPLSNLDAKLRVQMRAEISKLHKRLKTTMVYVTHDQVEAMTMGDRIVVMHEGKIQQVDTPLSLYQKPANTFVAGFIGSPAMNLLPGKLRSDGDALRFEDDSRKIVLEIPANRRESLAAYVDQEVVLGIRPEEMNYNTSGAPVPGRSISVIVEVAEPMGAETFLYFTVGEETQAARIAGSAIPETGEEVLLDVSMEWVHYFDGASQIRIPELEPVAVS